MLFLRNIRLLFCTLSMGILTLAGSLTAQIPSRPVAGNPQAANPSYPPRSTAGPSRSEAFPSATTTPRPSNVPSLGARKPAGAYGRSPVGVGQNPAGSAGSTMRPAGSSPAAAADPFQLTQAERERLIQILDHWEKQSSRVKTYSCRFKRWDYTTHGPKDRKEPTSISTGLLRYAAPDKGEFHVQTIAEYKPGTEGAQGAYISRRADHEEHWICDGEAVYQLNGKEKQLIEEKLPPEMKGNAIADGPLPFVFGAKREKLLARYWMKQLAPPANNNNQFWLDVRPKHREDAANFQRILVILDKEKFLPVGMQIYPPTWDGIKNLNRQAYAFSDRDVNDPVQRGREWMGKFISPQAPRGWKKVVVNFGQSPNVNPVRVATPTINPTPPGSGRPATRPQ